MNERKERVSDETFEEIWRRVNAEIAWRRRTPGVGRPVRWRVHSKGKAGRPEGEVAFVEFERIGMNTIESGKQTFVLSGGPDMVKLGPVTDFREEPIPGREEFCGHLEQRSDGTWVNRYRQPKKEAVNV